MLYLDFGFFDISKFWEMSLMEVMQLLDHAARRRRREAEEQEARAKRQIVIQYNQAVQIAEGVATLFNRKYKMNSLADYYPSLFGSAASRDSDEKAVDSGTYATMFLMYAYQRNAARHRAGKKDGEK